MTSRVVNSIRWSNDIHFLSVERNGIEFEPGNCIDIINPYSKVKKPYSIASSTEYKDLLFFFTRIMPSSSGVSQYISNLKEDDIVELGEPFGYFNPGKEDTDKKYIYIATGTGFAPFRSALTSYKHRPHAIYYGCRTIHDVLPMSDDCKAICKFAYSRQKDPYMSNIKRVTEYLSEMPTNKPNEYTYYLCGLEDMISSVSQYLMDAGVPWDLIKTEQFYYSK